MSESVSELTRERGIHSLLEEELLIHVFFAVGFPLEFKEFHSFHVMDARFISEFCLKSRKRKILMKMTDQATAMKTTANSQYQLRSNSDVYWIFANIHK